MADWQRPARVGLASFALTFAVTLLYNMSERGRPPAAPVAPPVDPAAVLESRGARITLGDDSVITADRQFGYDDGAARLVRVEVVVPAGENRTGFRMRSGEVSGVQEAGEWRLVDSVTIETEDGLSGRTAEASYVDATGIVTMPAPARFEQGWMRLQGDAARYDRRRGVVHLDRRAVVELRPAMDADAPPTRISAGTAAVDRPAGVMHFVEGATIDTGGRRMQADSVVVHFDPDASRIDAIELTGAARVRGQEVARTDLREMSAQAIEVTYRDGELERAVLSGDARLRGGDARPGRLRALSAPTIAVSYRDGAPDRATMTGGARVVLFGDPPAADGVRITGDFVETALNAGAAGIDELRGRERVTLTLPAEGGVRRRIRAHTLDIGGAEAPARALEPMVPPAAPAGEDPSAGGLSAVFGGSVEMREPGVRQPASSQDERIMRSDRLEATLAEGLARLTAARFVGDVTLAAGAIRAQADRAAYAPDAALFTLVARDADDRPPRMDDERGFLQARTIVIDLEGPAIEATGEVKGVLGATGAADSAAAVRPALFAGAIPIHFVAGRFSYDSGQSLATYGGGARLWQGNTAFRGQSIVLDETTGDIAAEGAVETRTTMLREDSEQERAVETVTVGSGNVMSYDNRRRQATYATGARLSSPHSTLGGETIEVSLREDAHTLHGIRATGAVEIDLEARRVTAATLQYDDREGRYEFTGDPVIVADRTAGECRETTGRSVTFYRNDASISADGQLAERTASSGGGC